MKYFLEISSFTEYDTICFYEKIQEDTTAINIACETGADLGSFISLMIEGHAETQSMMKEGFVSLAIQKAELNAELKEQNKILKEQINQLQEQLEIITEELQERKERERLIEEKKKTVTKERTDYDRDL